MIKYLIPLLLLICVGCGDPKDNYTGEKPFPVGSQVKYKTGNNIYVVVEYANYGNGNFMKLTYGEGYNEYVSNDDYHLIEEVRR